VWHVVVAKVGDTIVKVICKECRKEHRHKPPGGPVKKPARPKAAPKLKGSALGRGPAPPRPESIIPTFDPARPPRPYVPSEAYRIGDRVVHATFGEGIVESSPGPGKIQVYFPAGRRVLAMAKAALAFERPPSRSAGD
jgi:hypothetical protein